MSKNNAWETELLEHVFQNADVADIGDATGLRGSSVAGSLYISLHTANPDEAGNQTTNEAAYTSYARVAVARNSSNWSVTSNDAENINDITFPKATGGSETITHLGIGVASTGTGKLLYYATLATPIAVSTGITPQINAGDLQISES